MAVLYSNNATSTLAAGITNVATSLTVAPGTGALFPSVTGSNYFYATLVDASNNIEIVKVTARSTDTFTIVRAQEGTSARAYLTGHKVELRVTAAGLASKLDADGTTPMSGALAMGSNKITGLAAATVNGDAVRYEQLPAPILFNASGTSGGSANAQTVTATGFTLTSGYSVIFNPGFTNSGALTLNVNGLGVKNVYVTSDAGAVAASGGEVVAGALSIVTYDGTRFILINPAPPYLTAGFGTLTTLASATTTDLGSIKSHYANITGTTTITSLGSSASAGAPIYLARFNGILTLTHGADLLLPGSANITTAAGDRALLEYVNGSTWRCIQYWRTSGQPLLPVDGASMATGKILVTDTSFSGVSSLSIPVPSDALEVELEVNGLATSGAINHVQAQYKVGGSTVVTGYNANGVLASAGVLSAVSVVNGSTAYVASVAAATVLQATVSLKITGVQSLNAKGFHHTSAAVDNNGISHARISSGTNNSNTGLISDIILTNSNGVNMSGTYRLYKIK